MSGRFFVVVVATLVLVGCSDPKVDTSSEENAKASVEKIRNSLPENKRSEFDESLELIAFSEIDVGDIMQVGDGVFDSTVSKMKRALEGKTGIEIIAEANRIQEERKVRERTQAIAEITELEEKKSLNATARAELAKFEVLRSRFYKEEQEYGSPRAIIELSVRNGTNKAVSRAYFVGTLASPGRSVPWFKDSFNHPISGGLEPGEIARWSLVADRYSVGYSVWGSVDAPADAIFTVEVEKLDGADNKVMFSTTDFSEEDKERLRTLKIQYGIFK